METTETPVGSVSSSYFCPRNFLNHIWNNVNATHLEQKYVLNALMKLGPGCSFGAQQQSWTSYTIWATFWENRIFAYAKTKAQISCAVTAQLISAFVFTTHIVQSLYLLNPKFQASCSLSLNNILFKYKVQWISNKNMHISYQYIWKGYRSKSVTFFKNLFPMWSWQIHVTKQ